jgi:hypothetical protein
MRRTRWLAIALLALVGCQSSDNKHIKPPLQEEYNLPPADDARFSSPVAYPKDTLNQPPARPSSPQGPGAAPKGPSRVGSGGGMGGGY